jgi:integrase
MSGITAFLDEGNGVDDVALRLVLGDAAPRVQVLQAREWRASAPEKVTAGDEGIVARRSPATRKSYRAGQPARNAGRRWRTEPLAPAEAVALIDACSHRSPTGIRNRALVGLLYRCGLRLSEALALRPIDIDYEFGVVMVRGGNGIRNIGLDTETAALLGSWTSVRERLMGVERGPLFCTLAGGALSATYVRGLLPRLAKRAGLAKRVHPESLRATHAVELVADGLPLEVIQAQLGHASLASTRAYLGRLKAAKVPAEASAALA